MPGLESILVAAGQRLDESLDFDQTVNVILDIVIPALADEAEIHLLRDDGRFRRIAARHHAAQFEAAGEWLGDEHLDAGQADGPIHRMLAEGRSLIWSPLAGDDSGTIGGTRSRVEPVRASCQTSTLIVPLAARGRPTGVLTMSTIVRPRFDQAQQQVAEEIGRRASLALDNARLYSAAQQSQVASERAQKRMAFLAEASAALSASLDIHTTLQTVAELATREISESCNLALVEDDGTLRRVAVAHANPAVKGVFDAHSDIIPMGPGSTHPLARVLVTGQPYVNNMATEVTRRAYGEGPYRELMDHVSFTAGVVVPLEARGRRIGVMNLGTSVPGQVFDEDDVALCMQLASRAALAIDNARLYGAAQQSQIASERARKRSSFLAEASAALSASLDVPETLQTVVRLAVPEMAESCSVVLLEPDGLLRRVAVAHADPERQKLLDETSPVLPTHARWSHPLAAALSDGGPMIENHVTPASRAAYATGPYLEMLLKLRVRARLIVPLEARGRRLGVLTFANSDPARTFDEEDVALGQDLAARAALALENAQLYQDARTANDRLAEQLELSDAVVKNIAEAIIVSDSAWTVTYVNPIAELLLGQTSADLVGRDSHDVAHVRDLTGGPTAGHDCHIREAIRAGMTVRLDGVRFYRADGRTFPADVSAAPLMRDGQVVGSVTIFRDVSDRQQHREELERSEERLRRALASAGMVMWERSFESGRTLRSDLASAVYGRPNEELVDDPLDHSRLVHPDDIERIRATKDAAIRDEVGYEAEYRVLWPDGTVRWVSSRANVFRSEDGEPLGMSGTTYDITTRKQAELELERLLDVRQAEALELRQLHQRLRQRLEAVLGLHEVGKLLTSASDLDAAGRLILEIAIRAARLREATLRRRTSSGQTRIWQRVARAQGATSICEARALTRARSRTLATGQPSIVPVECRHPDAATNPHTVWCVPLVAKGDLIGVLESVGERQPADEPTLEILGSIALQAATALENARLYREVADSERALHRLVQQLMAAHEDERRRLAYEIHDGFAQMAAGVQQLVEAYAHDFPGESHAARHRMDIAIGLARQTVSEIRRMLAGLRPTVLDDFGLARGLRAYAEGLAAERLSVTFSEAIGTQRLPANIEIALFRLAQEALTNVRKHAGVDSAELRLSRHNAEIVLEVEDRGRGFDLAAVAHHERPGERFGLLSMHERIGHVNGTLEIRSQCGEGTLVRAVVPVAGSRTATFAHGGTDEQTTDAHGRRRRS